MKRTEQIYMFKRKKWWQEWWVRVFENLKASMKSPADLSSHFLLPIHYQSIKHFFFSFNICSKVIQISESFFSFSLFFFNIDFSKEKESKFTSGLLLSNCVTFKHGVAYLYQLNMWTANCLNFISFKDL